MVVYIWMCVNNTGWHGKTVVTCIWVSVCVCVCVCWHGNTGAGSSQGNASCLLPPFHQSQFTSCLSARLVSSVAPLSHKHTHRHTHSCTHIVTQVHTHIYSLMPSMNVFVSLTLKDFSLWNHAASHTNKHTYVQVMKALPGQAVWFSYIRTLFSPQGPKTQAHTEQLEGEDWVTNLMRNARSCASHKAGWDMCSDPFASALRDKTTSTHNIYLHHFILFIYFYLFVYLFDHYSFPFDIYI